MQLRYFHNQVTKKQKSLFSYVSLGRHKSPIDGSVGEGAPHCRGRPGKDLGEATITVLTTLHTLRRELT